MIIVTLFEDSPRWHFRYDAEPRAGGICFQSLRDIEPLFASALITLGCETQEKTKITPSELNSQEFSSESAGSGIGVFFGEAQGSIKLWFRPGYPARRVFSRAGEGQTVGEKLISSWIEKGNL